MARRKLSTVALSFLFFFAPQWLPSPPPSFHLPCVMRFPADEVHAHDAVLVRVNDMMMRMSV